jgi:proton glutamate symport protein
MRRFITGFSLTQCILICLLLGVGLGIFAPGTASRLAILSHIFLRLVQMLIVPLVFATLVVGIGRSDPQGSMRKLAVGSILFFLGGTLLAGVIGLLAGNLLNPGLRSDIAGGVAASPMVLSSAAPASFIDTLIPESIVQVMFSNNVLGLVFFTILFALALRSAGAAGDPVYTACVSLAGVMYRLTGYVMWTAPLGVLGAMAVTVSRTGIDGLRPYVMLLLTSYLAFGIFVVLYFAGTAVVARIPLGSFLKSLSDVWLLAYSTASSSAVLPLAMERLEEWGASRRVVSLVLPLGYSFNLTGPSLYVPLATVFWAQINGITLSWTEQCMMLGYVLVVTRGLPTIPRALFLVWGGVLAQFHLPPEGVVIMLGIDPLIDMARTVVNIGGNCLAVAAMDRLNQGVKE